MTIWQLLEEEAPLGCEAVQDLYSWSLNYDSGKGPFTLFIDVIGWSEIYLGERLYGGDFPIGYVESEKLAQALIAYANRPDEVMHYVTKLVNAEMGE